MTTEQMNRPGGVTAVLDRPVARLVYEVAGDGPAVVLIHGFGLDLRMWDPQVAALADRFRVVRYDCRGFGASGAARPRRPLRPRPGRGHPAGDPHRQTRAPIDVLARRIPGAAYPVIAGAGHLTSMEQPAAVSDLLARFVLDGASWAR